VWNDEVGPVIPLQLEATFDESVISCVGEFDESVVELVAEMDGPTRIVTDLDQLIVTDEDDALSQT
jgi:hypothetical protein